MSRTLLLSVLASTAWAICPNGAFYEAFFDKCYKVNTQPLYFLAAEQSCNKLGGNLVAIQSAFENAYVSGIATANTTATSIWIGANYLMGPQWSWTTGAPANFTNWAPNQPSDPSANECVAVREQDNAWTKEQCYSLKPSVCQIDPNTSPSPSPAPTCDTCPANAVCSPGYTFYIGTCKCYKVYGLRVSFTDAQDICAQDNGVLPKIPDNSTNEFLFTLVNDQYMALWIGLYCVTDSSVSYLNYFLYGERGLPYSKQWNNVGSTSTAYFICQIDPTTRTAFLEAMEFESSLPDNIISKTRRSVKSQTKKQ